MGILRLFSFLSRRYNDIIFGYKKPYYKDRSSNRIVKDEKIKNDYNPECEIVLIDLNAIFHPCCQKVFEYGSGSEKKSLLLSNKKKALSYEELEVIAFNTICNKIDELIRVANPSKAVYLAIDGVPGLCKQAQQRQRRFRSVASKNTDSELGASSTPPLAGFDPNCITTGTKFMGRLCNHIYSFIKKKKRSDWNKLKIVYNSMFVPGEGEHKLIRYLETANFQNICIMSPDADLIMLSLTLLATTMASPNPKKVTILRENVFQHIEGDYLFVDINTLKKNLIIDLMCMSMDHVFNEDLIIRDFVFFSFLIGNDFLPGVGSLEIPNKGIDILFKMYVDTWMSHGYLIRDVAKKFYINKDAFVQLLKNIASLEVKMLLDKAERGYAKYPDKVLNRHLVRDKDGLNIPFESYKKDFYMTKFDFTEDEMKFGAVESVCNEYILGMFFVLRYYFKGIPDFGWYYPYHYAPFFSDLAKAAEKFDFQNVVFQIRRPLTMYESLVGIMPPSSFHLLPVSVKEHVEKKITLDLDFLEEFDIDLDGKINDYEAILLLPFLSYDKIKALTMDMKLTEEEEKECRIGNIYVF